MTDRPELPDPQAWIDRNIGPGSISLSSVELLTYYRDACMKALEEPDPCFWQRLSWMKMGGDKLNNIDERLLKLEKWQREEHERRCKRMVAAIREEGVLREDPFDTAQREWEQHMREWERKKRLDNLEEEKAACIASQRTLQGEQRMTC